MKRILMAVVCVLLAGMAHAADYNAALAKARVAVNAKKSEHAAKKSDTVNAVKTLRQQAQAGDKTAEAALILFKALLAEANQ